MKMLFIEDSLSVVINFREEKVRFTAHDSTCNEIHYDIQISIENRPKR